MEGRITRFEPPHLVDYGWLEAAAHDGSTVLWELEAAPKGCRLRLTYTRPCGGGIADFCAGWHRHVAAMDAAVEQIARAWDADEWRTRGGAAPRS